MKTFSDNYTSGAASVTGLKSNATGATWPLTATAPTDGLAHLITIKGDAATDHSAKTAVITGTLYGVAQTETVALPNGVATVTSTKYFDTVTSVVPSATIGADTMDIGWALGSVSPWGNPLNVDSMRPFNVGFCVTVDAGSPTYTMQHTYDTVAIFDHASVSAETTSQEGSYTTPVSRLRVKFTAAGEVTLTTIAAHI